MEIRNDIIKKYDENDRTSRSLSRVGILDQKTISLPYILSTIECKVRLSILNFIKIARRSTFRNFNRNFLKTESFDVFFSVWYMEHTGWLEREAVSCTSSENCQDARDPTGNFRMEHPGKIGREFKISPSDCFETIKRHFFLSDTSFREQVTSK